MHFFTVWDGFDNEENVAVKTVCSKGRVVARFFDSDREANAALFIRAQHMDALVEAVKGYIETMPHGSISECVEIEKIEAILAKIGGGE